MSSRRPEVVPKSVHVEFVVDKMALGQISLQVSVSFHHCSIFTHLTSGGWTKSSSEGRFHRDIVSPHRNNIDINVRTYVFNSNTLHSLYLLLYVPESQTYGTDVALNEEKLSAAYFAKF
jgi:hypothetical protein